MDNVIPGVRLAPKDSEVVHLFLQRRVQHLPINNYLVFDMEDFYDTHPQFIPLPQPHIFLDHQESWFFVERTMQGQRVNRLVADNSGRWVGQKKYSIMKGGITRFHTRTRLKAELKNKKNNKPKRPSIKSLFEEDESSEGKTTHQGSFLNLLPTQMEDPEREGSSKSSSSGG